MDLVWRYEAGILEQLNQFLDEYRRARGINPLRLVLLGPPQVGKSHLAQRISSKYSLPLVDSRAVVRETIERLQRRVQGAENAQIRKAAQAENGEEDNGENEGEQEDAIDPADLEAERELLEELTEYARANQGEYPETHCTAFLRAKLASMACQNQGYVLDGYPTTRGEALHLFRKEGEGEVEEPPEGNEDENTTGVRPNLDATLAPEFVLVLEASDDWIKERAMHRPEMEMTTETSEEGLGARLATYRAKNTDDITVLNIFDECEIHPTYVDVVTGKVAWPNTQEATQEPVGRPTGGLVSAGHAPTHSSGPPKPAEVMDFIVKVLGKPRNYGPTLEEIATRKRAKLAEAEALAEQLEHEEQERQAEEDDRQAKAIAEWVHDTFQIRIRYFDNWSPNFFLLLSLFIKFSGILSTGLTLALFACFFL
jgi:adenylate kinase